MPWSTNLASNGIKSSHPKIKVRSVVNCLIKQALQFFMLKYMFEVDFVGKCFGNMLQYVFQWEQCIKSAESLGIWNYTNIYQLSCYHGNKEAPEHCEKFTQVTWVTCSNLTEILSLATALITKIKRWNVFEARLCAWCFAVTFNNLSVISWQFECGGKLSAHFHSASVWEYHAQMKFFYYVSIKKKQTKTTGASLSS